MTTLLDILLVMLCIPVLLTIGAIAMVLAYATLAFWIWIAGKLFDL